jgi:hypothetical protein
MIIKCPKNDFEVQLGDFNAKLWLKTRRGQ